MENNCTLALVCNEKIRLASVCIYGVMLVCLTTFIFLTILKYKVYGFPLKLLVGLEIVVLALLAGVVLIYPYHEELTLDYIP